MYYCGFTYGGARDLPLSYRRWFIKRINREISQSRDGGSEETRAAHHNTTEIRSMQGRTRTQVPHRMVRFT